MSPTQRKSGSSRPALSTQPDLETLPSLPTLPNDLTQAQHEAVISSDPLLCVLAGPGSGKTRVLTLRIAQRIYDESAHDEHILVCTFSRKAARELRDRLWSLHVSDEVTAGTFHKVALDLLRQYRRDRGLSPIAVLDDRRAMLGRILDKAGIRESKSISPNEYLVGSSTHARESYASSKLSAIQLDAEINWAKARLVRPIDYEAEIRLSQRRPIGSPERIAQLYGEYESIKKRSHLVDLDDLVWECAEVLAQDHKFAQAVRWRFRHLFVDETQDLNLAQFRLLTSILGDDPDLCVVGDPNQSIYGWNGADPSLLIRLPELLCGIRVIRLDENHRCSPQVVAVANAVLGDKDGRTLTSARADGPVPKVRVHHNDSAEANWVARQAWMTHGPGRRWDSIAVLARTNAQLSKVAEVFKLQRIPFKFAAADLAPASDAKKEFDDTSKKVPFDDRNNLDDDDDNGKDGVVLTTFHRAKGLQWQTTFVIGLSDGFVPIASSRTQSSRDEERRLLYVGLTRSECDLWCSWAQFPDHAGKSSQKLPRAPSPWLAAIERTIVRLDKQARPASPAVVSARIKELRALLEQDSI